MIQSMSRVHRCIDNSPMEGFQGIFKELIHVLTPEIHSYEEYVTAVETALDYYKKEYPQHRFKGKTCQQVRIEAFNASDPIQYPLTKNYQCIQYWNHIEELKVCSQTTR